MRAAPACQFSLQRFGVWRVAVLLVAALGAAAMVAWLVAGESPLASPVSIVAILVMPVMAALAASLVRTPAVDLRWDGRMWHLGPPSGQPLSGDLSVALDLGSWMLLRFSPTAPEARPRTTWLPVQRRGLESQWHALRCAVHSPRPALAEDAPVAF